MVAPGEDRFLGLKPQKGTKKREFEMFDCDRYVSQAGVVGPFNLDYVDVYCETQSNGSRILVALFIFSWAAFLTNMLGNTAANYFSPTLASICTKVGIPYDIAVCLLASTFRE